MSERDAPWPLYSVDELASMPAPKWLVSDHFTDGLTVMYGPPGSMKTFMALSWALSIATGRSWFGHDVEASPVLYVSGEGGGGLAQRIESWRISALVETVNLYLILGSVRLTDHEHVLALGRDAHAVGARLLVIDTLARSMAGADENSAQDMGLVVHNLDWIRRETGCAALVVHHSGVEGSRPRGSTALFGAADTLVRVTEQDGTVELACEKQKESVRFPTMRFVLTPMAESVVLAPSLSRHFAGFSPGD